MKKSFVFLMFSIVSVVAGAQSVYTLAQLKDSALRNNIEIRNAKHGIEAAQQQRKEAFTNFFPQVSGMGVWFNANKGMAQTTINPSEVIPSSLAPTIAQTLPAEVMMELANPIDVSMMKNGTIASVTAIQPVFVGGQIVNGNKLARVGEDVSILRLRMSENEVVKTTEQYFWQLVSLQEKMKTIAAVEAMLESINKDVSMAVKAGLTMRNDLLQVQLRQNEVESQKLSLRNGIAIVRMMMAQYCGLRDTTFSLKYNIGVTSPLGMRQDHDRAFALTPEYQLLDKQVEATCLQRRLEIGKSLPTVSVGAGYNYHNLLDNNHSFGMVFATVSLPISNWWGGLHAIKRKAIETEKAKEQLADTKELLKIGMQKAWNDVEEAYQQYLLSLRSVEQADENLRLNRDYYHAGTISMSDLLEAQMLYQKALDQKTDAFTALQNKSLEYRIAVGER